MVKILYGVFSVFMMGFIVYMWITFPSFGYIHLPFTVFLILVNLVAAWLIFWVERPTHG